MPTPIRHPLKRLIKFDGSETFIKRFICHKIIKVLLFRKVQMLFCERLLQKLQVYRVLIVAS